MVFRIMYLGIAFLMMAMLVMTFIWKKRKEKGMICLIFIAMAGDIVCYMLLSNVGIITVRKVFEIYYILHAWIFPGIAFILCDICRHKVVKILCIPTVLICIFQSIIVASGEYGYRIMFLSKRIFWGDTWWVALDAVKTSDIFNFHTYRIIGYIKVLFIIVMAVFSVIYSVRIFRARMIIMNVLVVIYVLVESITTAGNMPVMMECLCLDFICLILFILIYFYPNIKLKNYSLINFANVMSDGFVLYDEYDKGLYMNTSLKKKFPQNLVDGIREKENLDEWLESSETVENIEVLRCEVDEGNVYFKVRKNILEDNGYYLGTIYIFHDTTDTILRIRAMKEANIQLEQASKMKSDFLANMSHEIRTPMNAVIGMAEIVLREELTSQVRDYISQIQNSGKNLLNIINDILDFSKIEAGKMEIIPDAYEPLSELNDISNILATRIGDKELEFFVIMEKNIPHKLEGDVMRIRQVLINLANNAIKFTEKGMVLINVLCDEISEDEVSLTFHVIDTGTGIKDEDLDKLFMSFQQVDSKRNRSIEGTGLGLAISQRLCEAMNGSIGVKSEYGKGSDFYFTIPQKVLDHSLDLVVDDAEHKHTFVFNNKPEIIVKFVEEMNKFGVDGKIINDLSEYEPTGEIDFLFFDEKRFGYEIEKFMREHPKVNGVIFVEFDSIFETDIPNIRIMRRPETTLAMVMILNNREMSQITENTNKAYEMDFVIPDARILVVDDNAINITIVKGLLKPVEAVLDGVNSGKEAIEAVKNTQYDMILMDHMMPEMDGVEATKIIRETIEEAKDLPIIALTANAMEGAKEMFVKAGMNDFVAKPIDIRDLITKLKYWIPKEKIIFRRSKFKDVDSQNEVMTYEPLDNEKALQILGSQELFEEVVEEYYRSGKEKYDDIQDAYEREDWKYYTIKVHALKSSSRQIGAGELGDMAEEMEKAGKGGDINKIKEKNAAVMEAYKTLLEKLSVYFQNDDEDDEESEKPRIDEQELLKIFDELQIACDELDMDGMEDAKNRLKGYSYESQINELVRELCHAIDNIDADECMEVMEKIKNHF